MKLNKTNLAITALMFILCAWGTIGLIPYFINIIVPIIFGLMIFIVIMIGIIETYYDNVK